MATTTRDPRKMTPKGKPGSGLASSARVAGSMPAAKKKQKQANGTAAPGYSKTKGKGQVKKAAPVRGGTKSKRATDQVPGVTNYSYGKKK